MDLCIREKYIQFYASKDMMNLKQTQLLSLTPKISLGSYPPTADKLESDPRYLEKLLTKVRSFFYALNSTNKFQLKYR